MKKLNLYIETSVFGFYYDEDVFNLYKRAKNEVSGLGGLLPESIDMFL